MYFTSSRMPHYIIEPNLSCLEDCCDPDPCHPRAICDELPGPDNFTCTCIPPLMGDGFMCGKLRTCSIRWRDIVSCIYSNMW